MIKTKYSTAYFNYVNGKLKYYITKIKLKEFTSNKRNSKCNAY